MDRLSALLLTFLLMPLMVTIAVSIRLSSNGPALFSQERVGIHGRHFQMYKFRSMFADADSRRQVLESRNDLDGLMFKMRADPRLTPLGKVLRRLSLDELPQLINVLKGDMSLVGPRPPLPREVSGYAADVRRRLLVKPGMTGLWQISGRSDLSWAETVRLDLRYVENWTIAWDLAIIWKTLFAVLARRGAY